MPLNPSEIDALLKLPVRRGGGKKSGISTTTRDYATWFKLATKMVDEDTKELLVCANPECTDPRGNKAGVVVALVEGQYCCRYCFLSGWLNDTTTE